MLHVPPGPYRDEVQAKVDRLENELKTVRDEQKETLIELFKMQNSLSVERDETQLLRDENRRLSVRYGTSRPLVLLYGVMRWGLNRISSAAGGATFAVVLLMMLSNAGGPARPAHHPNTHVQPIVMSQHQPTMLSASHLFERWFPLHCYSQYMCHETCMMHQATAVTSGWTSGGENPLGLASTPYLIDIELVETLD